MTSSNETDQYALVSSFYGPGAISSWYLTALACLISFGLHLRKRRVDAITADLIAVLAYPTVAAAHLISQVRTCDQSLRQSRRITSAQFAASIEAALIVTEASLAFFVILFLLAVGFKCVKRACLVAGMGLFSFAAECYLHFSLFAMQAIKRNLDRPFLIDFEKILIGIMVLLLVCIILALGLIVLFFVMRPTLFQPHVPDRNTAVTLGQNAAVVPAQNPRATLEQNAEATLDQDAEVMRITRKRDFLQSKNASAFTSTSMLLMPFRLAVSMFPLLSGVLGDLPSRFLPWLSTVASRIANDLVPRSSTSIKELDQAVAVFAGATVLGFSLYSTAHSYHQRWLSRTCIRPQQRGIELMMHRPTQTLSH